MKQHDLECAVARQTGESVACIRRLGFSLLTINRPKPQHKDCRPARRCKASIDRVPVQDERVGLQAV